MFKQSKLKSIIYKKKKPQLLLTNYSKLNLIIILSQIIKRFDKRAKGKRSKIERANLEKVISRDP